MLLFTGLVVVGAFCFGWYEAFAYRPEPTSDLLNFTAPLGLLVGALSLLATCRIVGTPGGHLEVIGLVVTRRLPVESIAGVATDRGLRIVLRSGRNVGSVAFGQSLLGDLLKYPRSVRAAQAISHFTRSFPSSTVPSEPVVTVLRGREIAYAVGLGLLLVVGAVVINGA
jgi:hypothetical protein